MESITKIIEKPDVTFKKFLSVNDVPNAQALVSAALAIKQNPFSDSMLGRTKTLGLIFLNPSLRTRMSTQKAAQNLGMSVITLDAQNAWKLEFDEQIIMDGDKAEHIKEAAAVISQYCDIIGIRSFPSLTDKTSDYADEVIQSFVQYASVPVVSLESAIRHPCQSLADMMTIREFQKKKHPKIVLSWAPHPKALPQAVANSFAEWSLAMGHDLTITHPPGYELSEEFTQGAQIEYDQQKAFVDADFIYVKNWSSFLDYGKILNTDSTWMINTKKIALTNQAKLMHCLPVRRNVVISSEVLDSPSSVVIQQAANREYAAQAVLRSLLLS